MPEAPAIARPTRPKRLAVFLDGTWNAVGDNTNVWRLRSLCAPASVDGTAQLTYYEPGVSGFLGGLFGKGVDKIITDAYQWLIDHHDPGDEIFIFGFSRGAYTARSLGGFIAKCGLLKAGAPLGVKQLYNRYRRVGARTLRALIEARDNGTLEDATREELWMLKYAMAIQIKLVGVWDTVGELGVPGPFRIPGISRSALGFLDTALSPAVDTGFHALAIDEHRRAFSPTLWTVSTGNEPNRDTPAPPTPPPPRRPLSSVEQRWFVGAHANVGGGYESDPLPQMPLRWIMKKASLHGLAFRNDVELDGDELKATICDSYRQFLCGTYRLVSGPYYRPIGRPPTTGRDGTSSTVNETIDASVFARWNDVASYRPSNLADWAARHGVDMARLTHSVRAEMPTTPAPD